MEDKLRLVSFFAGAGGFDIGFMQSGFSVAAAYEWDKYALKSYRANVGPAIEQDISKLKGRQIPRAEVWCFGFPCQDISNAGGKLGLIEGERSRMFFEIMRLLGEVEEKPEIILAENVKRLTRYLPIVEEEYNKAGYRMYKVLYNSKNFGLAQSRERYFLLGVREDLDIDFAFPYVNEPIPKLATILEDDVPENFYIHTDLAQDVIAEYERRLAEERGPREPDIDVVGRAEGINGHDLIKRVYDPSGLSPTLSTTGGGNQQPKIILIGNTNPSGKGIGGMIYSPDGISPTVMSNKGEGHKILDQSYLIRKLIPREYASLQGFSKDYKQVVSNSQFYKQMGNAVSIPVAAAIAEEIKKTLDNL